MPWTVSPIGDLGDPGRECQWSSRTGSLKSSTSGYSRVMDRLHLHTHSLSPWLTLAFYHQRKVGQGTRGRHSFLGVRFLLPNESTTNKMNTLCTEPAGSFCPYFFLSSLPSPVSRQNLLQSPLQLRGHAGDHPALCRLPRGRPWPAGRRCLLPHGVRRGARAPGGGWGSLAGWKQVLRGGVSLAFNFYYCGKIYSSVKPSL